MITTKEVLEKDCARKWGLYHSRDTQKIVEVDRSVYLKAMKRGIIRIQWRKSFNIDQGVIIYTQLLSLRCIR